MHINLMKLAKVLKLAHKSFFFKCIEGQVENVLMS